MSYQLKKTKTGQKCSNCGESIFTKDFVIVNKHSLCDNCLEHYTYCKVCDDYNYSNLQNPCKHLYWDTDNGEYKVKKQFLEND